ncbi:unnamed protein product, partial [Owenia fusiformis]
MDDVGASERPRPQPRPRKSSELLQPIPAVDSPETQDQGPPVMKDTHDPSITDNDPPLDSPKSFKKGKGKKKSSLARLAAKKKLSGSDCDSDMGSKGSLKSPRLTEAKTTDHVVSHKNNGVQSEDMAAESNDTTFGQGSTNISFDPLNVHATPRNTSKLASDFNKSNFDKSPRINEDTLDDIVRGESTPSAPRTQMKATIEDDDDDGIEMDDDNTDKIDDTHK